MPVQRTFFGRVVNIPHLPRRFLVLFSLTGLLIILLILVSHSSVHIPDHPLVAELSDKAQHAAQTLSQEHLPKLWNPFGQAVHEPPEQANSTHAGSRWYSDWKWLNPFSSSVTLEEDRAVLPPLRPRTPIYTYYDALDKHDHKALNAEEQLLLIWRRAWWAQGFRPVVLGRPEAQQSLLFESLQRATLNADLRFELQRWLAWEHMGGGILANWLALPMASYDDAMLKSLRRGQIDKMTRYASLADGLFLGSKKDIGDAIKEALAAENVEKATSMVHVLPKDAFQIVPRQSLWEAVAYYDRPTIMAKYRPIAAHMDKAEYLGLTSLAQLINAHLQTTWQTIYSSGISVVKPLPRHTSILVESAIDIARNLSACPSSPVLQFCPPNQPRCTPCRPLPITLSESYNNKSSLFSIGSVPHPYTTTSLNYFTDIVDTPFVRRNTTRDNYLVAVTKSQVKATLAGPQLLTRFKEIVASEYGASHSLWLTPERPPPEDLAWTFGFTFGHTPESQRPLPPKSSGSSPGPEESAREKTLLEGAEAIVKGTYKDTHFTRAVVEGWNLADTEAWRFTMAVSARRRMERLKWEEEEKLFAGSEKRHERWGRWFD